MTEETALDVLGMEVRTLKGLPKDTVLLASKGVIKVGVTATDQGIQVEYGFNPEKLAVIKIGDVNE
jgi:hypothetical protein